MPTVAIYVKTNVARRLAERWGISQEDELLQRLVRSLCDEALDQAAGIQNSDGSFRSDCPAVALHRPGFRCRDCYGR